MVTKIRLMNVDLELNKFLNSLNRRGWYGVQKNGWGEPKSAKFGRSSGVVDEIKPIVFKAVKPSASSSAPSLWGKNYKFITIYEEDGNIVVNTSQSLYMSRKEGTIEQIIEQHNKDRQRDSIDSQIERLQKEKAQIN